MEREYFFSGYCRALDQSRMVAVETDGGVEADCSYQNCPYTDRCAVAEKIRELQQAAAE